MSSLRMVVCAPSSAETREALGWQRGADMLKILLVLSIGLLLSGCDSPPPTNQKTAEEQKIDADIAAEMKLKFDPSRTGSDFVNQLRSRVKVNDGFITVESSTPYNYAILPSSAPWVIQCGIGMSIVFGSAVTGDSGSVTNDINLTLTSLPVSKEHCKEWGMLLAQELRSMSQRKSNNISAPTPAPTPD
jgi:hypothetical protein